MLAQRNHILPGFNLTLGYAIAYLRGFAYRFIELCSAQLSEAAVREALAPRKDEMNLD